MTTLSFTATTIKSWFQYRCDRKTRYECMSPDEREAVPIVKSQVTTAWAQEGVDYERALLCKLGEAHDVLTPGPDRLYLKESVTVAFLKGELDAEFAHQAALPAGTGLRKVLRCEPEVLFGRALPDLIQRTCVNPLTFRIIDVKATQAATYFHKAQVAFYSLVLQSYLADLGVSAEIDEFGQIWHLKPGDSGESGDYESDIFRIRNYAQLVVDFFHNSVPRITSQRVDRQRDETFFHIYYKCEQCDYLKHCRKSLDLPPAERDPSALSGLTHEGKRALQRLGIHTVGALSAATGLVSSPSVQSWALKRKAEDLVLRAQAMIRDSCQRVPDRYTYLMPPRVDVGLYLALDRDAVQNNLVTLGYLLDWQGETSIEQRVLVKGNPDEEREALESVMGKLIADLNRVHTYNQSRPESERLHAHIFTYEPSEAKDLKEAVGRHLSHPRIREGLLHLVRLFPPEEVIPEPEYRGVHHLPATAVRSVIETLYTLPVVVSYDLRQVTHALQTHLGLPTGYRPEEDFSRPFSSRLSMEVIRSLRKGRGDTGAVRADLDQRLTVLRDLTRWLLEQAGEALRLQKAPFAFQSEFHPLASGDLEILRAYELLANKSGLLDRLIALSLPWKVRRDSMKCLARLKRVGQNQRTPFHFMTFRVPPESRDAELGPDDLGLILTNDSVDIRLNPSRWPGFAVSLIEESRSDTVCVKIYKDVFEGDEFTELRLDNPDDNWFIDESFADFNSEKIVDFLVTIGRPS